MNKCLITNIDKIIEVIDNNGIVAIPTDTIYGLGSNLNSTNKIIKIKKRENKPLAILCSSIEEMSKIIKIDSKYLEVLKNHTPGALTVVGTTIDKKFNINEGYNTTGVRIPNHPSLLKLLSQTGPLVVSSANISGETETHSIDDVYNVFKDEIDLYIENDQVLSKVASTVIDINSLVIYRKGENADIIKKDLESVK